MNSFELNKIMGAVFAVLLVVVGLGVIAGMLFEPRPAGVAGYALPEPEAADAPVADVPMEDPLPIRLANASLERGEAASRACSSCHNFEQGGANGIGPNLWDVVMGPKAHIEGFGYSSALQERAAAGEIWDYEALDGFIAAPRQYLPGTSMSYAGLRNAQERANLILYLHSLSDNPAPLPEATEQVDTEAAVEGDAAPAGEAAPAVQ
ncbi:MAG TPA: cytochrome c family protein [Saliniramus sp.]|nr:cytochrome c family protein [Saliniramus sp.]